MLPGSQACRITCTGARYGALMHPSADSSRLKWALNTDKLHGHSRESQQETALAHA